MKRLLNPDIQCTDPDQLQFCLKISDTEFWYCEPNTCHRDLLPCAETESNRVYQRYLGHPTEFLHDAHNVPEVRKFATDNMLWREGEIDVTDFSRSASFRNWKRRVRSVMAARGNETGRSNRPAVVEEP